MNLTVNGAPRTLEPGACVADLLPEEMRGTAVALNGEIVPRARYTATPLSDGDVVEIVTAVQGG